MEVCSTQWTSSQKSCSVSQNSRCVASTRLGGLSSSETTTSYPGDTPLLKARASSFMHSSSSGMLRGSNGETRESKTSWLKLGIGKKMSEVHEDSKLDLLEESQDPFAFHDDEFEPSQWDLLSGSQKVPQSRKKRSAVEENVNVHQSQLILVKEESINMESEASPPTSLQASSSSSVNSEKSSLLSDCLLTAVKVSSLTSDVEATTTLNFNLFCLLLLNFLCFF